MKKTARLQELFHRDQIFVLAGGACALHARMAEALGFEAAYMSGGFTSAYMLGVPDAGLITMTEMVENARRMAEATGIPLLADSDQGFGNAINVRRTVQAFIRAGAAGLHLEDQPTPKRCGFAKGKQVIPMEEAVGKYRAAVDAKRELDPDFVIVARCDARTAAGGGLEEAIRRLRAYKQAGVDVLYLEGPQSPEEIRIARAELEGPLIATILFRPEPTLEEQQQWGLAAAFYPALAAFPGMIASWNFLEDFRKRGVAAYRDFNNSLRGHPLSGLKVFDLVGFPQVREWEEKYLPPEEMAKYDTSSGLYDPGKKKARL